MGIYLLQQMQSSVKSSLLGNVNEEGRTAA